MIIHKDRGLVNFVKTHLQFTFLYGGTTADGFQLTMMVQLNFFFTLKWCKSDKHSAEIIL